MIAERIGSLLIGYALGNVLTAEIVTRKLTGRPCRELGTTGNPGMANVMAHLGFKPGIITLAGDLGKCALSCLLADLLFTPAIGRIAVLYAGVGCTLGHDFPVWQKFHGGKGVATSCLAIFLFSPLWGFVSNVFGMLVTFITLSRIGVLGGTAVSDTNTGLMYLFACLPIAVCGLISAYHQARTSVASIGVVAKDPDQFGKAMLFPAMVETYAILALLVSILAVTNI